MTFMLKLKNRGCLKRLRQKRRSLVTCLGIKRGVFSNGLNALERERCLSFGAAWVSKGRDLCRSTTYADHVCNHWNNRRSWCSEINIRESWRGDCDNRNSVVVIKLGAVGMIAGTIGVVTDAVGVAAELRAVSNSNCHWTINHVSYHVIFIRENVPIKRMYPNVFKANILFSLLRRPCVPLKIALQPVIL